MSTPVDALGMELSSRISALDHNPNVTFNDDTCSQCAKKLGGKKVSRPSSRQYTDREGQRDTAAQARERMRFGTPGTGAQDRSR